MTPRMSRRQWGSHVFAGSLLVLGGCGYSAYEQRLANTATMYERLEMLNQNLQAQPWSDGIVSMRMPLQFSPVVPPSDDSGASSKLDPRQPDYINVELPGLAAAFRAEVQVDRAGKTISSPAYIYVLGNYKLPPPGREEGKKDRKRGVEAATFHEDTLKMLARVLDSKPMPSADPLEWKYQDRFPPGQVQFVDPVFCTALVFEPNPEIKRLSTEFRDFLFRQGEPGEGHVPIEVMVLFVAPAATLGSEELPKRLELALETVQIRGRSLSEVTGSGEGNQPAAPGSGF